MEGFTPPEVLLQVPLPQASSGWQEALLGALPPAVAKPVQALLQRTGQDPFYAVLAYKGHQPAAAAAGVPAGSGPSSPPPEPSS